MENTFTFNLNNITLFGQFWKPETPKAVIVLVHGMGEHLGRYEHSVVKHVLKANYAVVAYDQFGHGKSKGKRGHCPSYKSLLDSLDVVVKRTNTLFSELPVFLYGHSLGGNIVINYALKRQVNIKGIIATSPFLRLAFNPPKWKVSLGKLMLNILPSITLPSEIEEAAISSIPNEVKRYQEDPLIHGKISPMYLFPVVEAGEYAINNAKKLDVPIFITHGTGDRIIDHNGAIDFCKELNTADLKLYDNGYHELHHDVYAEEMMQTIVKWLDKH
ncbi:alpha/beta hydrolase [uncultured Lacinutrix sp.]|uniref:alpha/beta hydrolase n=1 Tax=uncultured Lacinutrix sp. TaxID=574032 RepID=UPI0026088F92|nr:alpha/beta hydrolase [uncultured Lacinutrix sp.]